MSSLKRHGSFSATGTRPKPNSLATLAAAGAMRKAASVDFANVPEIMTTTSPSMGRRTPGKYTSKFHSPNQKQKFGIKIGLGIWGCSSITDGVAMCSTWCESL